MSTKELLQLVFWSFRILHIELKESIILGGELIPAGILCKRKPTKPKFGFWNERWHYLLSVPRKDVGRYGYQRLCRDCEKKLNKIVAYIGYNPIKGLIESA